MKLVQTLLPDLKDWRYRVALDPVVMGQLLFALGKAIEECPACSTRRDLRIIKHKLEEVKATVDGVTVIDRVSAEEVEYGI